MTFFSTAVIPYQDAAALQREGLPYWIFWFLLCIILLLSVFIFLRDKEMRQRINYFFIGAKHKSIIIRLRMKLKKEKQKREDRWKELGEKAWERDLEFAAGESLRRVLGYLEKQLHQNQMEWEEVFQEIQKLGRTPALSAVDREEFRFREKEVKEQERRRERIQMKIKSIERHRDHRLRSLGKLLDSLQVRAPEFEELYTRINEVNQRIFHLEQRIENLSL